MSTKRDWLDLGKSADIQWPPADYAPPPRPNDIPDPETPDRVATPVFNPGDLCSIDWVRGTPHRLLAAHAQWHEAVRRAADTGDVGPLIELLRSDEPLHRDSRDLLADLLVCRRLKRKRGRQADPTRVSFGQGTLHKQAAMYRYWRGRGQDHDEALRRALLDFKAEAAALMGGEPPGDDDLIDAVSDAEVERLHSHIRGKRGTTRRMKKRRPG